MGTQKIVKLPAVLAGVSSRKDRSYKLSFDTRELTGDEAATLLSMNQDEGWLLFAPSNKVDEQDIPEAKPEAGLGIKTSSQRLRSVIFVLWKQRGEKGIFDDFYRSTMETLIEVVKERLEER